MRNSLVQRCERKNAAQAACGPLKVIVCRRGTPSNGETLSAYPGWYPRAEITPSILLVRWLQAVAEALSAAFAHPNVVINENRPVFGPGENR